MAEYQVGEPCDTCVLISFGQTSPSVSYILQPGAFKIWQSNCSNRGTTVLIMSCNEKEETNNIYREREVNISKN